MPIVLPKQVAPAAAPASNLSFYADSATGTLFQIDESGVTKALVATIPTGTGYTHIAAGVQDAAAKTPTQVTADLLPFVASGASHAQGLVPDPGVTGGTTKFLREDATFAVPPGGGATPTGTGFTHITAGVQDVASKAVDLSSADATGVLAAARFPALTGDVTTAAGALASTLATAQAAAHTWAATQTLTVAPVFTDAAGTRTALALNNVTNNAQTQSAIVPNTVPAAGQLHVGNAGGTAFAVVSASGDVTVASTGAHTIAANAVTNAKAAQMAANTIKANNTAGLANAADISLAALVAMGGTPTGTKFLADDGTLKIPSSAATPTNVQIFTAGGTWTKPAGAQAYEVILVGGGNGGGSGRKGAAGTVRCGGGGGGAGGYSRFGPRGS